MTMPTNPLAYSHWRADLLPALVPHLLFLLAAVAVAWTAGRRMLRLGRRLRPMAADHGTTPLEFAWALPVFLAGVLTCIQSALLLRAALVVDYAAFCAARSASVWVSHTIGGEPGNVIRAGRSRKWERIQQAATVACLPISARVSEGFGLFRALGMGSLPVLPRGLAAGLVGGGAPARLFADYLDRWPYSSTFTTVQVNGVDASSGRQLRIAPNSTLTVTVRHDYLLDVPFVGTGLARVLGGGRRLGRPYVSLSSTYTMQSWGDTER